MDEGVRDHLLRELFGKIWYSCSRQATAPVTMTFDGTYIFGVSSFLSLLSVILINLGNSSSVYSYSSLLLI